MNIDALRLSTEQQELLRQQAVQLRLKEIGTLLNVHPDTVDR